MSAFKVADRVEIVGPNYRGLNRWLGRQAEVATGPDAEHEVNVTMDGERYQITFPASSLRLVPAFKAGDRVRLPGKTETTIKTVYRSDGGHGPRDLYELEDGTYRRLEELQHAPEPVRAPKAGEVWGSTECDAPMLVATSGYPVHLSGGAAVSFTAVELAKDGYISFLADSPEAYFKDRSC